MAVTLLQTAKGNGGGYVLTYNLSLPSAVTAGSLLVMAVTADPATVIGTITDTRGNTWQLARKSTGTSRNTSLYYVQNAVAGTTTVTIPTGNYNDTATIIREYSGIVTSAALDQTAIGTDSGYLTAHTSGTTPVTTQASELVIAAFSGDDAASTWTAGTGFGNAVYQGGGDLYMTNGMEDKIVAATGTQSATMTSSSGISGDSVIATFKAVASATYTSPTTGVPGASAQANWYTYGYAPNVALATRLNYMQNAWNQWVSYTVTQTGMPAGMPAGAYRVKVPDQNDPSTGLPNGTFSEGIGYGMLAAVWMGNPSNPKYDPLAKTYFDGFWAYYNFFKDANGLMNWRIDHLGNITGTGGATDGDTDVAMALVLASRLWGNAGTFNYGALATTLITAIGNFEFYSATHTNTAIRNTIINGDSWDASLSGSPDWVMPDYFAPGWYREFYNHTGDARWLNIITAGYTQLIQPYDTAYNTGMVPDNATRAGTQQGTNGYNFAYNAIRYPWRMVSDYLWNGTNTNSLAYYFPKKLAAFSNTKAAGVASATKAEWNLGGTTNAGYINAAFTQAYAASTLVDSTTSTWGASLYAYSDTNNTAAYFGNSLVLMSAILGSGQAVTTFAPPALTGNTNTVLNPSFESSPTFVANQTADGWIDGTATGSSTTNAFGWWASPRASGMSVRFEQALGRTGSKSLKVSTNTTTARSRIFSVPASSGNITPAASPYFIAVSPNTSYTMTAWVQSTTTAGASIGFVEMSSAYAVGVSNNSTALTGTIGTWTQLSVTATTGATTAYVALSLSNDVAGNVSDVWFDDVTFGLTPAATNAGQFFSFF